MSGEFYNLSDAKRFPMGPLEIDIPNLYQRFPVLKDKKNSPGYVPLFQDEFHKFLYKSWLLPLQFRHKLFILFRKIGIDDHWLKHFGIYWGILGGRPLWHTSDFFFLRNFYRIRQNPPLMNTIKNSNEHLAAWQDSGRIYALFQAVLKETFDPLVYILKFLNKLKPNFVSCLEFGSGSAPITTALLEFERYPQRGEYYITDLPTLTFHYATFKFQRCSNVQPIVLSPKNNFELIDDKKFDVIFCSQVFEHLNAPLRTAEKFYQLLNPEGILFFDYIKSNARDLDTLEGLKEREDVLRFIADNFKIEYGKINTETNIGLTVVRKLKDK